MELEFLGITLLLAMAGAVAGITAGLFGNGGGFVVVPALVFVFTFQGIDSEDLIFIAIGTSLATIVISSARAVIAHHSRGAVDYVTLRSWALWLVLGVSIGLIIASRVKADELYLLFATGVLLYAIYFLFPKLIDGLNVQPSMPKGLTRAGLVSFLGGFSSLLGIGGGTITVITMVTCGRKIYQAVATAAGVGFIIGISGAIGFVVLGLNKTGLPAGSLGYINIPALMLAGLGSMLTAPIGVKWAHNLDENKLKRFFGLYLIAVSAAMFWKANIV